MVVETQTALGDAGLSEGDVFSEGWEEGAVAE
jgi:hypothetical protein